MITFIVTTYNLDDWLLRRCLRSIVSQGLNRERYEIIVVDDESAVSPQHVVDEFAPEASIALYVQKHARQGAARNLGLRYAKGDWVQFVDGDDYLFAGTVASALHVAQTYDLDLLMFGFCKVYDEEAMSPPSRPFDVVADGIVTGNEYMSRHNLFGSCCTLLFRRRLCNDMVYGAPLRFTEHIYIEDEEFATRLVWRAQRMASVDVPVYAYYQRAGSTVHSRSREHTDELFRNYFIVLRRLIDFEESIRETPHEGVVRKLRLLAVDILRRALREPDWRQRWEESALQLRSLGLNPIPMAGYSWKYRLFCLLAQCGVGRCVLRFIEKRNKR